MSNCYCHPGRAGGTLLALATAEKVGSLRSIAGMAL
jgi:hypothetical protein